jgi:acetamidase/formamidase
MGSNREEGQRMAEHRLEPQADTVTDVISWNRPPVLTIDPGDTVVARSLDASGHLSRQRTPGDEQPLMFADRRGHCLIGPIAVRGARAGQVLAVQLRSLRPDDWGFTVAGGRDNILNRRLRTTDAPSWLLWQIDNHAGVAVNNHGLSVRTAPFLGVIGLPPAEPGEHSTIPPRTLGGGNIDCRELVAGSTLYLPITVDGAYLHVGDGHAAQGDGEVGGTAIECGMTTEMTIDVVTDAPLDSVHASTPTGRITFGFSADLNEATGDALDAMLRWMRHIFDVDRTTALALASTAVDMRVTQIANQTWGVHALLRHDALDRVAEAAP